MSPVAQQYFSASEIAKALGTYRKSVHRRAAAERWTRRERGNLLEYLLPPGLRRQLGLRKPKLPPPAAQMNEAARAHALVREQACLHLRRVLETGLSRERALRKTAAVFGAFKVSATSLRRWQKNYDLNGLAGLFENKAGRSGRKPNQQGGER